MRTFLDTNILYKFYRAYVKNNYVLNFSSLRSSNHKLIISESVLIELETICCRKRTLISIDYIEDFLIYMNIRITKPDLISQEYADYVYDLYDAHIVWWAIHSKSQVILTHNVDDFNIDQIYNKLNIQVISHLEQLH